jgi:hypothetical protein
VNSRLKAAERVYRIKASWVKVILLSPAVIVVLYIFSLLFPPTRSIAILTLNEKHLVETLTFVFLLLGGVLGLVFVWRTRKRGGAVLVIRFYLMFSILLLVAAAEEVAWGQQFLDFETPTSWGAINRQDETTLHNVGEFNGRSEVFRLAFGLGGLLGVLASSYQRLRNVGAPAILLPWFSIIAVMASVDLYADYFPFDEYYQRTLDKLSELIEMMIGASGLLFVWLNARMLSFHAKGSSRSQGPTHA